MAEFSTYTIINKDTFPMRKEQWNGPSECLPAADQRGNTGGSVEGGILWGKFWKQGQKDKWTVLTATKHTSWSVKWEGLVNAALGKMLSPWSRLALWAWLNNRERRTAWVSNPIFWDIVVCYLPACLPTLPHDLSQGFQRIKSGSSWEPGDLCPSPPPPANVPGRAAAIWFGAGTLLLTRFVTSGLQHVGPTCWRLMATPVQR